MNKKFLPLVLVFFTFIGNNSEVLAQTKRNVVVEHFTNTRCGICSNRNPGLFNNLKTSPEVFHVSYHPSSPYSSCELNKHNTSGNDDRTKFYGVYGSTPRVVVQGVSKGNGQDFTTKTLFSGEQGKMTPVDIKLTTLKKGKDSLNVRIVITNLASNSLSNMSLYAIAVEDTVFYNAPNGETEHHNVFRKVLLNQALTLPSTVGDSIVLEAKTENNGEWNASRMYVMAFAMKDDKKIEQVASSEGDDDVDGGGNNSVSTVNKEHINVFPNPASTNIVIHLPVGLKLESVVITDLLGNEILTSTLVSDRLTEISIVDLPNGNYICYFTSDSGGSIQVRKLSVLH